MLGASCFSLCTHTPTFAKESAQGQQDAEQSLPQRVRPSMLQLAQSSGEQWFDIPAGDLQSALLAFSRQAGIKLLCPTELITGLRTQGVKGNYAPEQALGILLAGTRLGYRLSDASTVTLERVSEQHATGPVQLAPIAVEGASGLSPPAHRTTAMLTHRGAPSLVWHPCPITGQVKESPPLSVQINGLRHIPDSTFGPVFFQGIWNVRCRNVLKVLDRMEEAKRWSEVTAMDGNKSSHGESNVKNASRL